MQSRTEGNVDAFSQIMALRVMHSLIKVAGSISTIDNPTSSSSSTLTYAQLVSCAQASIFCLSELGVLDWENDDNESDVTTISCCCQVLADLISFNFSTILTAKQSSTLHYTVMNGITSKPAMKALSRLLSYAGNNKEKESSDNTSALRGCSGDDGALDGALILLSISTSSQTSIPIQSKGLTLFALGGLVAQQILTAGSGEISPRGSLYGLRFIASILSPPNCSLANTPNHSPNKGKEKGERGDKSEKGEKENSTRTHMLSILAFANHEGLAGLLSLVCSPLHLDYCQQWGVRGTLDLLIPDCECSVIDGILESASDILKILMAAISAPQPSPSNPSAGTTVAAQDSQKILEGVYRTQLIKCLLQALNTKKKLSGRVVASIVHVLSELVLTSSKFMAQFVEWGGLEVVVEAGGSAAVCENRRDIREVRASREKDREREREINAEEQVTVCMLQMSSHLARHSEKHFQVLQVIFTPLRIIQLLSKVRAFFMFSEVINMMRD